MRTSLTVVVVLAAAACAPVEGSQDDATGADTEGALTLSAAAAATVGESLTSTARSSLATSVGTVTSAAKVPSRPKPSPNVCANYDAITAALGSRTIDCLGTIGPESYGVDSAGNLVPRFDRCTEQTESAKEAYDDIVALLSLQQRKSISAEARRCIAGRWESWRQAFAGSGIKSCPVFRKVETINTPTEEGIKRYAATLPKLPARETGKDPATPHENYLVELKFPGDREQRCKDEADCARQCLGGFPGTFIDGDGTKALLDPTYWLLGIPFPGTNPFMSAGYYHPMSFYGTPPGALFGHRYRAGEACSRFVIDEHVFLTLQLDCLDPAKPTTCVSVCEEAPVDTAGSL